MSSDNNDREAKAKAFAWRAIGCAVWLGIILVIGFVGLLFFPASFGNPFLPGYFR